MDPSLGPREGTIAWRAETRGLLRLPVRVERPRDVLNPNVLSMRGVPGRRILSNAIPANGLCAPTSDRSEHAECNAPPTWGPPAASLLDFARFDLPPNAFLRAFSRVSYLLRQCCLSRREQRRGFCRTTTFSAATIFHRGCTYRSCPYFASKLEPHEAL